MTRLEQGNQALWQMRCPPAQTKFTPVFGVCLFRRALAPVRLPACTDLGEALVSLVRRELLADHRMVQRDGLVHHPRRLLLPQRSAVLNVCSTGTTWLSANPHMRLASALQSRVSRSHVTRERSASGHRQTKAGT